jgi:hypothetical protein
VVKCSKVLQCSDGLGNKVSNIIGRLIDNMKLLLICTLLLSHSFIFFRFYFFMNVYKVLFLLNIVIYVFLLSYCMLCMATLTEVFPCFFLSCKANASIKPGKTGNSLHYSYFLCCSMYCLFCVVLCIVCVYMCTVLLALGGYSTAMNKYII